MIDRTEHDDRREQKGGRATVDDDPHADHSLDPNEHYGQESDIPKSEEDLDRGPEPIERR